METIHGTVVDIDGAGVLLRGPSGSGKSDLALRLIDRGAALVADDRVILYENAGTLAASAPEQAAGKLEIRGLGIVTLPHSPRAALRLVVDLVAPCRIERLPKTAETVLLGVALPVLNLAPFEASAPAKVRLALRLAPQEIER
jgi:serine kinase of HPr protein (carbohydrate metabolism regulator)